MRNSIQPMIPVVVVAALFGVNGPAAGTAPPAPLTAAEVYRAPITGLVGKAVTLVSPVTWDNAPHAHAEAGPDTLFASPLALDFHDLAGLVDLQHPAKADIRVVSSLLETTFDGLTQVYRFRGRVLERGRKYVLTGSFAYRDWLSPPPVENPAFLEQSNRPAYWSQTFEFKLLQAAPVPAPPDSTD